MRGTMADQLDKKLSNYLTIVRFGSIGPIYVRDLTVGAPCSRCASSP